VLTIKKGANVSYDPSLLKKIPDLRIYRSATFEPLLRRELTRTASAPQEITQAHEGNQSGARPGARCLDGFGGGPNSRFQFPISPSSGSRSE